MAKRIHNLVIPGLDDKTFEELVDEARSRIPLYAPEWTDHNISDPGITFVELFAWLAEMQIYRLNQVPRRNYLKFLKLLGERPRAAKPSKVDVTFTALEGAKVCKGSRLTARESGKDEEIIFETDADLEIIPTELKKIVTFTEELEYTDCTDANTRIGSFYHAFGKGAKDGSVLYLGFDRKNKPAGKMTLKIYLYEKGLIARGEHGGESPEICISTQLIWEYRGRDTWRPLRLRRDEDGTVSLTQTGVISLKIPSDIELWNLPASVEKGYELFWIRCRVVKGDYEIPPRIDTIRINTISATQGRTIEDEMLEREDGELSRISASKYISLGLPNQVFKCQNYPIIDGTQNVVVEEPVKSRNGCVSKTWLPQDDLDASGPEDNHYVLHAKEGGILFGDGVNGRIPPTGSRIIVCYRSGGGEIGNISSNAIRGRLPGTSAVIFVENERPATGGTEQEPIDDAQARVREDLKVPYTAVTAEDYETIAKSTPGLKVRRAYAYADRELANLVNVIVVPDSPRQLLPAPSEGFLNTVCRHLDKHRLVTTRLRVSKPEYIEVSVNADIWINPQNEPVVVKKRVEDSLADFLHPLKGGADRDGWPFGRNVYQSEIYAVIERVEGVDRITQLTLSGSNADGNVVVPESFLVCSGKHTINVHH